MSTPRLALRSAFGLLVACALLVVAGGPAPSPSVAAPAPLPSYAADPAGGLPFDPPASTATPTPTVEPEYDILDYIKTYRAEWTCEGPFGTIGHRYLTDCNPFGYFSHPTNAYVDRYASPAEAQSAWQNRRDTICPTYPICFDTGLYGHPAYEAGNNATPYAHYEKYVWASVWLMGAVSTDDTMYRGAPPVADMLVLAARRTGYIGLGSHTPQPTPTATATSTATRTPVTIATPTPLACISGISGSISSADPVQQGGLDRAFSPSQCLPSRSCPGLLDSDPRHYKSYTFHNTSGSSQCITVTVDGTGCFKSLWSAAYRGTFDPNNICSTNYAGDTGDLVHSTQSYSFMVSGSSQFTVVVYEAFPDLGCAGFNLSLHSSPGCNITASTPTPQPASTGTSTPTPTVWPTSTSGTIYDLTGTAYWASVCPAPALRLTTHFAASASVTVNNSVMRITNNLGQSHDVAVPPLPANTSYSYDCIIGECVPSDWATHFPYTLTVDVLNYVTESNESNNTYVQPYPPPMPTPCAITPTNTSTPTPGVEPEFAILQRVKDNNAFMNCVGPLGTPGHRWLEQCIGGAGHVAKAYVDRYNSPAEAQAAWQNRRDNICPTYPLCVDSPYRGYTGYEAGNYNYPYAHHENYLWGNIWLMGAESTDDTLFVQSPFVAREVIDAAIELGYLAEGNPTVTPTSMSTSTPTATQTGVPLPTCTVTFEDVPPDNTFYPFVRCLACRSIVSGYACGGPGEPCTPGNDSYFRPNNPVTRGQLSKIVSESAGFDEEVPPSQWTFTDVPYGSTFWEWVGRLANREVMAGYPCGSDPNEPCDDQDRPYFRPNAGATRGQLTKIVSNAAAFNNAIPPTQYTFTDVPSTHTFWLFVERLLANRPDVMSGYTCGGLGEPCDTQSRPYFRPNNPLTRGQTSKIVSTTFFPSCNP